MRAAVKNMLLSQINALSDKLAGISGMLVSWLDIQYVVLIFLDVLALLLFIFFRQKRRARTYFRRTEALDGILSSISPGKDLEKSLADFLNLIIPLVDARGYYFYLLDEKSGNYMLKAVRNNNPGDGRIGPSYSGLSPYMKENYSPPLGIPAGGLQDMPAIAREGEVPVLEVPVGGKGLIRIAPVEKAPKESMRLLTYMGIKLQPAMEVLIETERMRRQVESVSASSQAIRSLTRSALDLDGSVSTIIGLCMRMVDAAGGSFLFDSQGRSEVVVSTGLEKEAEDMFRQDHEAQRLLHSLARNHEFVMINREMKEFFDVPSYFAAAGMETVLLAGISGSTMRGTALFWYYSRPDLDRHRLTALQMLARRLGDSLDRQAKFRDLSNSYLDMLRMLVDTVDSMEPFSIGHSMLVSRYSGIIAKEMRMGEKEVKDIILAGYLHDVGMLGLSGDILFKAGKYTDIEYETMKLHAEVGASIVESTISMDNVASLIRHHHERWDGFGYPGSLKGEEIPLGARIIAVADTFNAKLTGRKYREPASFERALADIRAASGSQLDPASVNALISWFRRKQADPSRRGRVLGPCWEMKCCPQGIARYCPAYRKSDVNCWEVEGTNCAAHGSICRSCVVHTEFMSRAARTSSENWEN